jgi:hypothetical protein
LIQKEHSTAICSAGSPRAKKRAGGAGTLNAGQAWILGGGWIDGIGWIFFCGFQESVL